MSRSISLHGVGRSADALTELERVIEMRKKWYAEQGRPEFADELARAYCNKAVILQQTGDLRSSLDCRLRALELYRQVQMTGRRDIRREMVTVMGDLGDQFWILGAENEARKLLAPATFMIAQLLSDPSTDKATRSVLRPTSVTRYYQLSRLAENSPDPEQRNARESLLDKTLEESTSVMAEGATAEVLRRFFEASKDKALLLSARGDNAGAEKLMSEALSLYRSISRSHETAMLARDLLSVFLLGGGSWALVCSESSPKRALAGIDEVLREVPNVSDIGVGSLDQLALTWLARSRICREISPAEMEKSAEKAFLFWRTAVSQSDNPVFLSKATYFAGEHIDWCQRSGRPELARRGALAMLEILKGAMERTGRNDLAEGVASWRQHYRTFCS